MNDFLHLGKTVIPFIKSCKHNGNIGGYRYSTTMDQQTLYSSAYAAMTYSLLGLTPALSVSDKKIWADYLNNYQDADGLYRDPIIYGQGWYTDDPLWCGRAHLTCHVLTALGCLGYAAEKPLLFLNPYKDKDTLIDWLSRLDFGKQIAWTGNELMNIGTLLQYSRDSHADKDAGEAVDVMLEWLSSNHINEKTGLWGSLDIEDPLLRSDAVQAAYHWWPLFLYDKYPVPFMENAIDNVLKTQNVQGGFGWGRHNPESPFNSSACEDIDSIDPLTRFSRLTSHRRSEVRDALLRAKKHVLSNQQPDGGFVFIKDRNFEYGHPQLSGAAHTGAMFPTWFRTLSIALIDTWLCETDQVPSPYTFVNIPGFQFWDKTGRFFAKRTQ